MIKSHSTIHISLGAQLVLLFGANLTLVAGASLSPVIPNMALEYSTVPGVGLLISLVLTLPALFVVLGGPIAGFLTDKLGRKPVLVLSILLGGFGGSLGVIINTLWGILFTRVLVGISIAGAMTATNSLIADYFDGERRTKFMGRQAAIGGLISIVVLPIGGIVSEINWRLAFLTYLPLLILLPLALFAIKEPEILDELDVSTSEFDLRLNPVKGYIFAAGFLSQFGFVAVPIYIAYLLNGVLGTGGEVVGWLGAASSLFSFFAGMYYSSFSQRYKFKTIAIGNYILFFGGFLFLGFARSWMAVIIGELVVGFCMGLNNANLANWLSNVVDIKIRGRANGIFVTLMSIGPFIAPFIYSPIISRWDYPSVFIISGIIFALMALAGMLIRSGANYAQVG
ncbi:MAG: MFS transporter [Brevefilum sp.]